LPSDEASSFQRQHHLVNRRRADAEIFLHVGFGRGSAVQARIVVDKGQILPLLGGEGLRTHAGHPIQLFMRASNTEARMNVRYRVELSQIERDQLAALLSGGKHASRKLKRAQILLAADAGASDEEIARSVGAGGSTVYRTKRRFVEGNLERALSEEPRPGAERKLTGKEEALLVATVCASPPEGRARWTLELLAGAMVKLTEHKSLSHETVRRRLAENGLKPWRKDMWCIPKVDGEYVARMEDVLDLYAEAPDPKRPVVCFDESPVQLTGEVRQPIPARPGQLERYDYEYRRNGTVNLFVLLDLHRPWRKVKVTERRAAEDYAHCMRDLVDIHYPDAKIIRVVQDNLSTHSAGALYQTFPPAEARRILRRLEFHYTPKHATWLNMVEIEIGVLRGQCLDRRIDDPKRLHRQITAWERRRNAARSRIKMDVHNRQGPRRNGPRLSCHFQRVIITVQSH
jgi:transposase